MAESESRDQVLIDFQAVSGIDDFDLCTNILTQHEWNLERAVNSIMGFGPPEGSAYNPVDVGPSPAEGLEAAIIPPLDANLGIFMRPSDHGASDMASGPSYSSSPLNFTSRMLNFNVEYRDKNTSVVLPDSETVGRIKEVLESELGIPRDKQELKGLVKRKVDDTTLLRELYLPRDNNLFLLTPDITNPTVNRSQRPEGEGTSQGLDAERDYMLNISFKNGTDCKHFKNLKFEANKTVRDVKQSVMALTDVAVRHQQWTGWGRAVADADKLFTLGLRYPSHDLEMSSSEVTPSSSSVRVQDLEDMEVESDEEEEEEEEGLENYSIDEDLFSDNQPSASQRLRPLMSDGVQDDKQALEEFTTEFTNRYGAIHPQFFVGSLDDAIQESLSVRATNRKLLAVYLHHDASIFSNVFCSQLLCAEGIINYLSHNFLTWAWDLTSQENMNRFLQAATRHFGSLAASQMRNYSTEQLPCLLLISRSKATNEVIAAIQGHVSLDEMMTQLIHTVEVFQEQRQSDIGEEKEREAREMIKQEQDEAYQESLALDRKKAEAQKVEETKQKEAFEKEMEEQKKIEDERREEEMKKDAISRVAAQSVPDEPPPGCTAKISNLRFRVTGGEMLTRRFYADNSIGDMLNYLTSKGFHIQEFKVLTTFPRRDISTMERSDSLESSKLYPQETLILEER